MHSVKKFPMQPVNNFFIRHITGIGIVVTTVLMLFIVFIFYQQKESISNARNWVVHTYEVRSQLNALQELLKTAELSHRNYLISNDEKDLEPYRQVASPITENEDKEFSIWAKIAVLRNLTKDNAYQQHNLDTLGLNIKSRLDRLEGFIQLQKAQSSQAVMDAINSSATPHLDATRQILDSMRTEEARLLEIRSREDEENATRSGLLTFSCLALFYIGLMAAIWLVTRQWVRALNMEAIIQTKAQEVEHANTELRVLNEKIREQGLTRLRAVVDNAIDGLITLDADGTIESFNPACERMFGYMADEIIGKSIGMLLAQRADSESDYGIYLAASLSAPREIVARRADHVLFPMEMSISAFVLEGSKRFSAIVRDITARKDTETRLLRYTRELERSNQELDDFAYIASHDLKEPLRGLFNHASFLMEDYHDKLGEDGVHRLQRLSVLAQRMERLVNDLLYFSRLGRTELAVQEVDPAQLIVEIEQLMENFLKERNAHILIPKAMPKITCDRPRIVEVFRNLITNAIKYNNNPEPLVTIGFLESVETPQGTERNVFYVKDNGIGIEPEFHQEIFRIFKRLNSSAHDKEAGTGVGLTFVKKIIERHNGRIWLDSKFGEGTTFYFNLGRKA